MKVRTARLSLFIVVFICCGCGENPDDRYHCYADETEASEVLHEMCGVFNSNGGPLEFVIDEEFGPHNVHGEISAEGSGAGESLRPQGHLMIDIDPQTNEYYLSGIHIDLSDFQKGVG